MILLYATCSGINEYTSIPSLVKLMGMYQFGEIAVQVSEKQSSGGNERIEWVRNLAAYIKSRDISINAALHVGHKWVEELCRGNVVPELKQFLDIRDIFNTPLFKRVQLDFKMGRDNISPDCVENLLAAQQKIGLRFILPYNKENEQIVKMLHLKGLYFDCLHDESPRSGKALEKWSPPVFSNVMQGYSGGISPSNVYDALGRIMMTVEKSSFNGCIYIDAQKGLEEANGRISLDKCHKYLRNAKAWYENYRWRSMEY